MVAGGLAPDDSQLISYLSPALSGSCPPNIRTSRGGTAENNLCYNHYITYDINRVFTVM